MKQLEAATEIESEAEQKKAPEPLLLSRNHILQLAADLLHVWNDEQGKKKRKTYFPSSTKTSVTSGGESPNTSPSAGSHLQELRLERTVAIAPSGVCAHFLYEALGPRDQEEQGSVRGEVPVVDAPLKRAAGQLSSAGSPLPLSQGCKSLSRQDFLLLGRQRGFPPSCDISIYHQQPGGGLWYCGFIHLHSEPGLKRSVFLFRASESFPLLFQLRPLGGSQTSRFFKCE